LSGCDDANFFRGADFGVETDFAHFSEADDAGLHGEEGIVFSVADIFSGDVFAAALAENYFTGNNGLAVVPFDSESFGA